MFRRFFCILFFSILVMESFALIVPLAHSSVSKDWTIIVKGFFVNYMQDVEAFEIEIMANWQSNTWTREEEYTVGFTITGQTVHEYVDWMKITYVEVQLRPDPGSFYSTEYWRNEEIEWVITNSTQIIYVDCTPTGYAKQEDLHLVWFVNIEWQFTIPDGNPYSREVTLDNKGQGVYDPIPISLETPPSINWISIIIIGLILVSAIGSMAYLIIRKRRKELMIG